MKTRDPHRNPSRLKKWLKPLIVLCVLALFSGFWAAGLGEVVQEPHGVVALVDGRGWQGLLFFGALFVFGGALGIPPALFVVAAGLLWPFSTAVQISFLGG
ncbi:MAG: hypothetical protein ACQEUB_07300, partial [Thermodesulfobacteriota bacterium]